MNWQRIAHRGTPREFPANTMAGFVRAGEYSCTMVECDVRRASDGVLVLAHDAQVTDKRSGKTYRIDEHESAVLHALDLGAGEGVPTLTELAQWATEAKNGMGIMADMKCEGDGIEAEVVSALAPLPVERRIVAGAGETARRLFRALDPALPLSLSLGKESSVASDNASLDQVIAALDTQAVTWEHPLLTADRIERLHTRGVLVYAWTVDDTAIMRRLLDDGADGIISNRADLLQAL